MMFRHEAAADYDGAYEAAVESVAIAERFRDVDLLAMTLHVAGLARIKQGRIEDGLALLDEAMVSVAAGEVAPFFTGIVYCGVIASCEEAFEPRRAREWTDALAEWCESQPQLVSFTGRCLAHRAGIKQLHGDWTSALEEARLARERCEQAMNRAAAGQAYYQQAELLRLLGDLAAAEEAYRNASGYGREPQPGLALLRLAQGELEAATGAIGASWTVTTEPLLRAVLLPAFVEIMLAAGQLEEARTAAGELEEMAAASGRPMLAAIAAYARGAVELAAGDAQRRSSRSTVRGRSGKTSTLRTRSRGRRSSPRSPAASSATTTLRASSSRRRASASVCSARRRTRRGSTQLLGESGRREPRADAPRARGPPARRRWQDQSRDRLDPRRQRAHGRASRPEHPPQAASFLAHGSDRVRLRAPARLVRTE